MKKLSTIIFLSLAGALTVNAQKTVTVTMGNTNYINGNQTITVGDQVTWSNTSTTPHTSDSGPGCTDDGIWQSGTINPGGTFSRVFGTAGTFPYHCDFHCSLGMVGTITVQTTVTGVNDYAGRKASGAIKTYPNPAEDLVTLEFNSENSSEYTISVYDFTGKELVHKISGVSSNGLNSVQVPTSNLMAGLYFVNVKLNDEVFFDTIVKK